MDDSFSFKKTITYTIFFILLSALLIVLDQYKLLGFLHYSIDHLLNPVRKNVYANYQNISGKNNPLLSSGNLTNYLEVRDLSIKVLTKRIKDLEKENEILRNQLKSPIPSDYKLLVANVIGANRFLLIDKGTNDKVKINNVVVFENILVGKVVATKPKSSKVMLPLDPDSKIAGLDEINGVAGLVVGQFQTSLIFDKVLVKEKINNGDYIVTSGEEEIYPPNLIIAKVEKVIRKENDIFQSADLKPLLNYQKLSKVFVIID